MNKKRVAAAFLVLVVALAAYVLWRQGRGTEAKVLYGNVDIRDVSLAFRVAGRVATVAVDEGDVVHQGQMLAVLDGEPLRNNVRSAEAQVDALSARNELLHKGYRAEDVAQAKARLESAQAALREADRQLVRERTLAPDGATSERALEAATSTHDQAAAQVDAAAEQWRSLSKGYRTEEIAESDAQLQQARVQLDIARLALQDATLLAPSDGVVLTRAIEVGSMVQVGSPAFAVSLTQPVWIRAYAEEPQLGYFPNGAAVLLHSDTPPQHDYHGVVGFVSPTAEFTPKSVETPDLRTALVYRLRIVVRDPDAQLRQGMPVTVRLAP